MRSALVEGVLRARVRPVPDFLGVCAHSLQGGTVKVGETLELTAMCHVGTGMINQSGSCEYKVSNPEIASVNPDGGIVGIYPGTVTVTAELDKVESVPLEITVLP